MMLIPLIATFSFAISQSQPTMTEGLYVGTYTASGGGKGIYYLGLDLASGKISAPELAVGATDPSYVAVSPDGRFVYAIDESTDAVSSFSAGANHHLTLLNTVHGIGAGPCYVSVTPDGRDVLTAGYGGGTMASLRIRPDGSLGPVVSLIQDHGKGPNADRQDRAHMHIALADARSRFAYSCDLGTDEISVYKLDTGSARLVKDEAASTKAPAGGGPRHIAFHRSGRVLFANNEMGDSVTSYSIDSRTGALRQIQTISTLPEGASPAGNTTAEIVLHPNGKWLYVSNRGNNSIAVYSVTPSGSMTWVESAPLDVKIPRGFDIDPSGRWLVVAGQSTNDLSVWKIDAETGKLTPTKQSVHIGSPVSVTFMR